MSPGHAIRPALSMVLVLGGSLLCAWEVNAQVTDCTQPDSKVDRYVCASSVLVDEDARLHALYLQALSLGTSSPGVEVRAQYEWKRQRDRCNREREAAALASCVDALYRSRLDVLEPQVALLQAGTVADAPTDSGTRPQGARESPFPDAAAPLYTRDDLLDATVQVSLQVPAESRTLPGGTTDSVAGGPYGPIGEADTAGVAEMPDRRLFSDPAVPGAGARKTGAEHTSVAGTPSEKDGRLAWAFFALLGMGALLYFLGVSSVEHCRAEGLCVFEKRRHVLAYPLVGGALAIGGFLLRDQPEVFAAYTALLLPGWWALLAVGARRLNPEAPAGGVVRVFCARLGAIAVTTLLLLLIFVVVRKNRPSAHHSPAERMAMDAARFGAGLALGWVGLTYLDYVCQPVAAWRDDSSESWLRA